MTSARFEDLLGSTKLFLNFINSSPSIREYYKHDFRDGESYKVAADMVDRTAYDRETVASIVSRGLESRSISGATRKNIAKLARPNSLVVFGGQQVGMLLGPMYTVLKALTVHKQAERLESELGRPVVPCFWMATDDHDFDEIKTAGFLDREGRLTNISYEPVSISLGAPMADISIDDGIDAFIVSVKEQLIETEFTDKIIGLVRESYAKDTSLPRAFTSLFENLLGEFGIVPVDPNYPGMKRMMSNVFKKEIEEGPRIFELFEARSQALLKAGYHRQVHKTGESLNLFLNDRGRKNITAEGDRFRLDGTGNEYSRKDLLNLLDEDPEKFSPNVCLRPVAQCAAFPTVCQITGPSETAYFAQVLPIFEFMEIPFPVIRPRIFATVMEPQIKRIFQKLSFDFASVYNDREAEAARIIREKFPPELQNRAESLRDALKHPLQSLADSLKESEYEAYQAIEHSMKKIDHEMNHLSKKLFAVHKKSHDNVVAQIHRAASFLFPDRKYQERVISPVYFANKFGPAVFERIAEQLDLDSVEHQVVEVGN